MKTYVILFMTAMAVIIASAIAQADGDKRREGSPILPPGDNTCYYTLPDGIDLDTCDAVTSPDHSQVLFFCDGLVGDVIVICGDSDE
jgi:hypothetical protein